MSYRVGAHTEFDYREKKWQQLYLIATERESASERQRMKVQAEGVCSCTEQSAEHITLLVTITRHVELN